MEAMDNNSIKALLLGFAEVINEQRVGMPMGCVSKAADGTFNAHSIKNVSNLKEDVNAPDGFIKDGLMVRFSGQKKAIPVVDKWHGYRAIFELNGIYNGVYSIFTKTEFEYKIYLNRDSWRVIEKEIEYRALHKDADGFKRIYKEVMTVDLNTGEFRCADSRVTIESKVKLAMSSKLGRDYDAFLDGKMFDESTGKFGELMDAEMHNGEAI